MNFTSLRTFFNQTLKQSNDHVKRHIFIVRGLSHKNNMLQLGKRLLGFGGLLSTGSISAMTYCQSPKQTVYDFEVKDITGETVSMEKYRGHVLLIVNVASLCGLTATNYKELVELDEKYREKGLRILAFPCNQFSNQEPGNADEIVCFAKTKNANFDFFEKVDVKGKNASPLWQFLVKSKNGFLFKDIKWNFTKFIINSDGAPVERHGPMTPPSKLTSAIEKYLKEKEATNSQ